MCWLLQGLGGAAFLAALGFVQGVCQAIGLA